MTISKSGITCMKLLARVAAFFDRLISLLARLSILMIAVAWVSVLIEIVMRYFLNKPQAWVVEFTEFSLIFITFLAAAWVLKREGHVKMDLVINRLNPRNQALLNGITSVFGAALCLAVIWWTAGTAWDYTQRGIVHIEMLQLPKGPLLFVIPVGFFLLFIQFVRRSSGYLRKGRASGDVDQNLS